MLPDAERAALPAVPRDAAPLRLSAAQADAVLALVEARLAAAAAVSVPVERVWGGLRPLADATSARPAGPGSGPARWRPFGDATGTAPPRPALPVLGLIASTPTYALGSGPRRLGLTLELDLPEQADLPRLAAALVLEVSTADGWSRPASATCSLTGTGPGRARLDATALLAAQDPAVAPPPGWDEPAVRLLLAPAGPRAGRRVADTCPPGRVRRAGALGRGHRAGAAARSRTRPG